MQREYEILAEGGTKGLGRRYMVIRCPFCGISVKAFLWSLAGSGKRCDCGAKFTSPKPIATRESND